ncbi:hypothetical protein N7495_003756 [Penicillium taxi]|uniref:uncharacterized protein n=1 Tax=Penicillium taxi TaxID=168475 RepID=UPI0025450773|nr:uncharacterized protein N7495_003756 [Penicillium taxi]KAJ5899012.1 hypothetical protein N7495_003756 [Penicillium taxi]
MKASFVSLIAAMATGAMAAPLLNAVDGLTSTLGLANIVSDLDLKNIPVVSKVGDLTTLLDLPATSSASESVTKNGKLVQNLGPELDNILTITGPNVKTLLIELSPEVTALVSGLGLPGLGVPLGSIVASASSLGDLVSGLGPTVDGLVTLVGADVGALLVSLSPEVAGLVSGLGLPTVGVPVGTVVATLGTSLKRGEILQDLAPATKDTITVTGSNSKQLLVKLSPSVTSLVAGLGLTTISGPVGSVIKTAGGVGDLLEDLSVPLEQVLIITGDDGQKLLVQLSPSVVSLVAGLGLTGVATPVGAVVSTVGTNL